MDTYQIHSILKQELGDTFLGVFARDQIPTRLPPKFAMVVNTHPAHKPGEHWVAIYVDRDQGEYFDSYGLPPPLDLEKLLDKSCTHYSFNPHQLQDYFSFVCGEYCIYYLYHRYHGQSLKTICDNLRKEGDRNDCIVSDFVNQNWDPPGSNWEPPCGQTCRCLRDYGYK